MDRLVADYADSHPMTAVLDVDADINYALLTCRQIDELSLLKLAPATPSLCLRLQRCGPRRRGGRAWEEREAAPGRPHL